MIKVILSTIFIWSLIANVSGDLISCYTCLEGMDFSKIDWSKNPMLQSQKIEQLKNFPVCSNPVENSDTKLIDSETFSCITLKIESHEGEKVDMTMRLFFPKGKCKPFEELATIGPLSTTCRECSWDKCNSATISSKYNSATSISASFFVLIVWTITYVAAVK